MGSVGKGVGGRGPQCADSHYPNYPAGCDSCRVSTISSMKFVLAPSLYPFLYMSVLWNSELLITT